MEGEIQEKLLVLKVVGSNPIIGTHNPLSTHTFYFQMYVLLINIGMHDMVITWRVVSQY